MARTYLRTPVTNTLPQRALHLVIIRLLLLLGMMVVLTLVVLVPLGNSNVLQQGERDDPLEKLQAKRARDRTDLIVFKDQMRLHQVTEEHLVARPRSPDALDPLVEGRNSVCKKWGFFRHKGNREDPAAKRRSRRSKRSTLHVGREDVESPLGQDDPPLKVPPVVCECPHHALKVLSLLLRILLLLLLAFCIIPALCTC